MGFSNTSLSIICVLSFILIHSFAQNSAKDYLDAHNVARALVGVGPLQWDENIASYAWSYANQRVNDCRLAQSGGPYGENLARSSGVMSGVGAVRMWVNEKQFYNYTTNSCAEGKVCGHYTQVVWRRSVRLGCAGIRCSNGGTFVICNYDPRGNVVGQKPY